MDDDQPTGPARNTKRSIILSYGLWRERFGGADDVVGRVVRLDGQPLTIVGIMPDGFAGLSGKAELWIPPPMAARLYYAEYLTTPQNFISVVARLKDGVTLQRANAELAAIGSRFVGNGSAPDAVWGAVAAPVVEARTDRPARSTSRVPAPQMCSARASWSSCCAPSAMST